MALPTARELEALKVLWDRQQASVREIHQEMVSGDEKLAYTTVLSLIQTMEKKGFVTRQSQGRGKQHMYFPNVAADSTLRQLAGDFLDKVFDGAVGQYLVRALEASQPSGQQLDELEAMIAQARNLQSNQSGQQEGTGDV